MLTHMDDIVCIGPLMDHNIDTISNYMHGNSGLFDVSVDSVREFLMFMDYWVE